MVEFSRAKIGILSRVGIFLMLFAWTMYIAMHKIYAVIRSLFSKDKEYMYHNVIRHVFSWMLPLFRVKIKIKGKENIPKSGQFFMVANGAGEFDWMIIFSFLDFKIRIVVDEEYLKFPMSMLSKNAGYLRLRQDDVRDKIFDSLNIIRKIDDGHPILIFLNPVTGDEDLEAVAMPGPAYFAIKSRLPVIPINIDYSVNEDYYAKLMNKSPVPVKVNIGKAISSEGYDLDRAGILKYKDVMVSEIKKLRDV